MGKSQVQYVFSRFHEIKIPTMNSGQAWLPLHYVKVRTVKYETVCRSKLNKIPIFYFPSEGKLAGPLVTAVLFFCRIIPISCPHQSASHGSRFYFSGADKESFFVFAVRNV